MGVITLKGVVQIRVGVPSENHTDRVFDTCDELSAAIRVRRGKGRMNLHCHHCAVRGVVVSDLKESTFFAVIHLTVKGERVVVDARPSDAIALALRTRAPILVEETVIDNAKTVDFASEAADSDQLQKWLEGLDPEEMGKYKM